MKTFRKFIGIIALVAGLFACDEKIVEPVEEFNIDPAKKETPKRVDLDL